MNIQSLNLLPWFALGILSGCQGDGNKQGRRPLSPGAPLVTQGPSASPRSPSSPSRGGQSSVVRNAPTPEGLPASDQVTPQPSTIQERAVARLNKALTARALPHLQTTPEQLHGVQLLASAPPEASPLDALLVQVRGASGRLESFVLLLDENDELRARLPRALRDGPHALRMGALRIHLADTKAWMGIATGKINPTVAGSVLRLGSMIARDHLLVAASKGWASVEKVPPVEILILGFKADDDCLPGEVPRGRSDTLPKAFRVETALSPTLQGWSVKDGTWQGIAQIRVVNDQEQTRILRVGLQGRLP